MRILLHPMSLAVGVLVVTAGIMGFRWGAHRASNSITTPAPDTVYVDRPLLKRDTVRVVEPVEVKVFHTVQELRTDTVRVPVGFNYVGVIGERPITYTNKRDKLVLTSFDTRLQAFTQRTYSLPQRKWGIGLYSSTTITNQFYCVSLELDVRYRRIRIVPRIGVSDDDDWQPHYGVSVKYKLF